MAEYYQATGEAPPYPEGAVMKSKPLYAIGLVDQALRLAQLLLLEGALSITEAAHRLAVSPSTVRRLSVTHLAR